MKKSETMQRTLQSIGGEVKTTGHLRQIACSALTALIKGEISNGDAVAVSKTLDSVAKNLSTEIQAKKLHMQIMQDAKTIINPKDADLKLGTLEIGYTQQAE